MLNSESSGFVSNIRKNYYKLDKAYKSDGCSSINNSCTNTNNCDDCLCVVTERTKFDKEFINNNNTYINSVESYTPLDDKIQNKEYAGIGLYSNYKLDNVDNICLCKGMSGEKICVNRMDKKKSYDMGNNEFQLLKNRSNVPSMNFNSY